MLSCSLKFGFTGVHVQEEEVPEEQAPEGFILEGSAPTPQQLPQTEPQPQQQESRSSEQATTSHQAHKVRVTGRDEFGAQMSQVRLDE